MVDERSLPKKVLALCEQRDWKMSWSHRGCYLHLEAAELIEAWRGKRGEMVDEAADVLCVLMSITEHNVIPWESVLDHLDAKIDRLIEEG